MLASNPYYFLDSVSGFERPYIPDSDFNPIILTDVNVDKIEEMADASDYVRKYKKSIQDSDEKQAITVLSKIFLQRKFLFQALVEAAIDSVGIADLKLTEFVFEKVNSDISGIDAILITRKLAEVPNKKTLYADFVQTQKELVKNPGNKKVKAEFAKKVIGAIKGTQLLEKLLDLDFIERAVEDRNYDVLNYADRRYVGFLYQVSEIKQGILDNTRKNVVELTKGTAADRKLGLAMEEGKINK